MAETKDIERLRERIHRQRERLGHSEPVEPAVAEAVPATAGRRPPPQRQSGGHSQGGSMLASLGRVLADHPALAIGIGATVLVAGPQRSLRLARHAVRGAVFVLGAYRGASAVLGLLPSARRPGGNGGRHKVPHHRE